MDSRWDHNSNSFSHTPATNPSINCYQAQRFPHDESARFNVESYAMSNPPVSTWTNNNNYIANPPVIASFINSTPCVQEQTRYSAPLHKMASVQNKVMGAQSFGYECIRSGYNYNHNAYRAPYACIEPKPFERCVFDID
eukprot:32817_1